MTSGRGAKAIIAPWHPLIIRPRMPAPVIVASLVQTVLPTDLPGLVAWWEADRNVSVPGGGNATTIQMLDNAPGGGHTAAALTNARTPTIVQAAAPNSGPLVRFANPGAVGAQFSKVTTNVATLSADEITVYLTLTASAANVAFAAPFDGWNSDSWVNDYGFYFPTPTTLKFRAAVAGTGRDSTVQTVVAGTPRTIVGRAKIAPAGSITISVWNSDVKLADTGPFVGVITKAAIAFWFGSYTDGSSGRTNFAGDLLGCAVYNVAHSDVQVASAVTYWKNTYAT